MVRVIFIQRRGVNPDGKMEIISTKFFCVTLKYIFGKIKDIIF